MDLVNENRNSDVLKKKAEFVYKNLKTGKYTVQDDDNFKNVIHWVLPDDHDISIVYDPDNGNRPKIVLKSSVECIIHFTDIAKNETMQIPLKIYDENGQEKKIYIDVLTHIQRLAARNGNVHINFNGSIIMDY